MIKFLDVRISPNPTTTNRTVNIEIDIDQGGDYPHDYPWELALPKKEKIYPMFDLPCDLKRGGGNGD